MADGTFDGIIVGGGYNGLTLGGYMARQGLRVLVLERRMAYGGATITEEVTDSSLRRLPSPASTTTCTPTSSGPTGLPIRTLSCIATGSS